MHHSERVHVEEQSPKNDRFMKPAPRAAKGETIARGAPSASRALAQATRRGRRRRSQRYVSDRRRASSHRAIVKFPVAPSMGTPGPNAREIASSCVEKCSSNRSHNQRRGGTNRRRRQIEATQVPTRGRRAPTSRAAGVRNKPSREAAEDFILTCVSEPEVRCRHREDRSRIVFILYDAPDARKARASNAPEPRLTVFAPFAGPRIRLLSPPRSAPRASSPQIRLLSPPRSARSSRKRRGR